MKIALKPAPLGKKPEMIIPSDIILAVLASLAIVAGLVGQGTLGEPLTLRSPLAELA